MNPVMSGLTAHVDLSGLGEGWHTIRLGAPDLKLPPGVTAERLSAQTISLRLARSTARQESLKRTRQQDRPSRQRSK